VLGQKYQKCGRPCQVFTVRVVLLDGVLTDRPSMADVVSDLEHAVQLHVGAEGSGELAGSCMSGRHGSG
jgi:hypothetical protein